MLIELQGITKSYGLGDSSVKVLSEVDLTVQDGDFLCLFGQSGSGKSTLLNIIGLIDEWDQGNYLLKGTQVGQMQEAERTLVRRENISFIFQNFNLMPVLSAIENVMMPLQIRGVPDGQAHQRASEVLERLGMLAEIDRYPDNMSGGQRQRVAIARALVTQPSVILADEPTANLDSTTGLRTLSLIRELNEELGTTLIMATHNQALSRFATRSIALKDGRIVPFYPEEGAPERAAAQSSSSSPMF